MPYDFIENCLKARGFKRGYAPFVVQEGSETRSKGCPTALSPISVRTEMGCLRGMSANRLVTFQRLVEDPLSLQIHTKFALCNPFKKPPRNPLIYGAVFYSVISKGFQRKFLKNSRKTAVHSSSQIPP